MAGDHSFLSTSAAPDHDDVSLSGPADASPPPAPSTLVAGRVWHGPLEGHPVAGVAPSVVPAAPLPPLVGSPASVTDAPWLTRRCPAQRTLFRASLPTWRAALSLRAARFCAAVGTADELPALRELLDAPTSLLPLARGNARTRERSQAAALSGRPRPAPSPATHPPAPPTQPPSVSARLSRKIVELCSCGAMRKAARLLGSTAAPLPVSAEVLERLQTLHPAGDTDPLPSAPSTLPPVPIDAKILLAASRLLARGAAPGLDGWTRELLAPLLDDRSCSYAFVLLSRSLAEGRYKPIRGLFTASLLIPLSKKDGGVRPIAVESMWLRLASHAALLCCKDAANAAISPLQYGVGLGTERAVHALRRLVDANPERAFALLDFRNAFNTVSRRHILRRAYGNDSLRPLWGLIDTCYGTPEPLLVFEGVELRSTLWSRQGVRQGSVLGPFLFALAIDEELQQLGSDTVAYLDDITVSAAPSEVPAMLSHVETLFGPLGLELNRAKTTVLCATPIPGVSTSRCGVALSSDFVRALGAPIGWDVPAMRAYILRAAEKQQLFFARVASLHPVVALRLLALCGVPRFTFLARVSPPHLSAQAAEVFDSYVVGALHAILRRPLSPPELALACLPVRLGGLGTRLFSPILGLCYANSVADVPQGQHTETLEREQQLHERLVADFPAVAPLLRASLGRGANLWLVGHGSEDFPRVLPTAAAARIFLSARVGIVAPPPAAHQTLFCRCRARLPDSEVAALHVFSCHRVSRTAMHNAVARALQRELEAIGIPCSTDLRRFNGPSHERPDLLLQVREGTVAVDVTIVHPCSRAYCDLSEPGGAAAAAEATKVADSASLCASVGCAFSPMAFESWGAIGPKSWALLSRLGAERLPIQSVAAWRRHVLGACQLAYIEAFGNAFAGLRFSLSSVVFPVPASSSSSAAPVASSVPSASSAMPAGAAPVSVLSSFVPPLSCLDECEDAVCSSQTFRFTPVLVPPCVLSSDFYSLPPLDLSVDSRVSLSAAVSPSSSRVSTSPPPPSSPRSVVTSPQVECT